MSGGAAKIGAVVFDLDDTLYPETDYVKSGFAEVGKVMESRFGISDAYQKLLDCFLADRNDVYGRVLSGSNAVFTQGDIADLVRLYRTHTPKLTLSEEVRQTLSALRKRGLKLGVITDGRPYQQRAKMTALGIEGLVDCAIVTDELGGEEYRKPHPKAFETMYARLDVAPNQMIYVGDNPKKDFAIKRYLPVKTVMLQSGLYRDESFLDGIEPDTIIQSFSELLKEV